MRIVRPRLFRVGFALLVLAAVSILSGCAGASFLNDLEGVLPTVLLGVTGLSSIAASLSGNPALAATIQTIVSRVQQNVTAANSLVQQYKQTGSQDTLEQIEALIPTIQQDLDSLPAVDGLPPNVAQKIKAITDIVGPQLAAMLSSLPVFKPSTAGQTLNVTKPIAAAQFRSNVQAVIK